MKEQPPDPSRCSHKFVDSVHCLKCGIHVDTLKRERDRELARLGVNLERLTGKPGGK